MKEHEIYYVYEEFRWQGNWTSVQWPPRISHTDLYLANLLACRSQSPPAEGLQHLKILFSFTVWRQPQKTCETNVPLKNIENWKKCTNAWVLDSPPTSKFKTLKNWKKCTNAWVLDSPPTSKFKTLKKVNSIQFESPTCSYTLRPSRVKWRRGYNFFSASNCNEWRGTTSSLQRRECSLSSSKKSDP